MSKLNHRTLTDVMKRLALAAKSTEIDIPLNLNGLNTVYKAWCRNIPFDNALLRIHYAKNRLTGASPATIQASASNLPGLNPEEFFTNWLTHGVGGTSWASSIALYHFLRALQFQPTYAAGSMVPEGGQPTFDNSKPNHGTLIVTLKNPNPGFPPSYLVDPAMLSEEALSLIPNTATEVHSKLHDLRAKSFRNPNAQARVYLWDVFWKTGHNRAAPPITFRLDNPKLEESAFMKRYQEVEASPTSNASTPTFFSNQALYVRKNQPDGGILTLHMGLKKLIRVDAQGAVVSDTPVKDKNARNQILKNEFRFSDQIINQIPQDDI